MPVIRRCMTQRRAVVEAEAAGTCRAARPPRSVRPASAASIGAGGSGRVQRSSSTSSASIRAPDELGLELAADGLDLGQLGHARQVCTARRRRPAPSDARPRVGLEVDLLDPLGREVGVDLGRRDVGVAEHLLDRAQVAAAGEQVGGEAVAERVRAHPVAEADRLGAALDDLVEALAGQRAAALVEEQRALVGAAGHLRPAGAQVAARPRPRPRGRAGRSAPSSPCRGRAGSRVEVDASRPRGRSSPTPAARSRT